MNVLMTFSKIFSKLSSQEIIKFILEPAKYLLSVSQLPAILMSHWVFIKQLFNKMIKQIINTQT